MQFAYDFQGAISTFPSSFVGDSHKNSVPAQFWAPSRTPWHIMTPGVPRPGGTPAGIPPFFDSHFQSSSCHIGPMKPASNNKHI